MAVSRFRTRDSVFLLGRVRATDWLPVGGDPSSEQCRPGYLSDSDDTEDDMGPSSASSAASPRGGGRDLQGGSTSDVDGADPAFASSSDWGSDEDLVDPAEACGFESDSDDASVDPAMALQYSEESDESSVDPAEDSVCRRASAPDTRESEAPDALSQPASPPADCPTPEGRPDTSWSPPMQLYEHEWDDALGAWVPVRALGSAMATA